MQEIFTFLMDLERNNNREWFQCNKDRYKVALQTFEEYVSRMIEGIRCFDSEIPVLTPSDTIYSIYRDMRFSADKTPYKVYMSAAIKKGGKKSLYGGYYIHIQPGHSLFGGGAGGRNTLLLKALRKDIYDNMDEFKEIVENEEFSKNYVMSGDKLKKPPFPFRGDSSIGEWLSYKSYTPGCYVSDSFFTGKNVVERSIKRLRILQPLNRFLNYTLEQRGF